MSLAVSLRPTAAGPAPAAVPPFRSSSVQRAPASNPTARRPATSASAVSAAPVSTAAATSVLSSIATKSNGTNSLPASAVEKPSPTEKKPSATASKSSRRASNAALYVSLRPTLPVPLRNQPAFTEALGIEGIGIPALLILAGIIVSIIMCFGMTKIHHASTESVFAPDREARQTRLIWQRTDLYGTSIDQDATTP